MHGIYAKYFGLSLTNIAAVLLVCRIFDAVTDPVIGFISDRYYENRNSRKPFVIVGGFLLIFTSYFLFSPDNDNVGALYFLICMMLWYLSLTFFEVSHLPWGAELTIDAKDKTILYSFRSIGVNLGHLCFYLVPFLPFLDGREYNPQTLLWVVILAAVLMFPSLWLCCQFTPDNHQSYKMGTKIVCCSRDRMVSLREEFLSNSPLMIFLITFFFYGVAGGVWFSMQYLFIDVYLGLGEYFSLLNIIGLCMGCILIGFWIRLSNIIGKKITWCGGILIYVLSMAIASQLVPENKNLTSLVWVMILFYSSVSAIAVLAASLLADIIDYSTWKFGINRAATYFSLLLFSVKTTAAIGSALGLGVAGWYGFDPSATFHTPEQAFGLRIATFGLPIPILIITLVFIAKIPMNESYHEIVRRRLKIYAKRDHQAR